MQRGGRSRNKLEKVWEEKPDRETRSGSTNRRSSAMVEVDGRDCDSVIREYDRAVLGIDPGSASRKTKFVLMGEMSDYLINEILDDADYLLVCDSKSAEANRRRSEAWKALLNKFERKYPGSNITADMARRHFHYHRKRILASVQAYEERLKETTGNILDEVDPRTKFTTAEGAIYEYAINPKAAAQFGDLFSLKLDADEGESQNIVHDFIPEESGHIHAEALMEENMENKERQPAMTIEFTLRLLQEFSKSKAVLKCGRNKGEARQKKKAEWERIKDELNSQFGTSYSVMQIYKKVENVKGKVKQKLENLKKTGEQVTKSMEIFNPAEQYFLDKMEGNMDVEFSSQFDDDILVTADDELEPLIHLSSTAFIENITAKPTCSEYKVDSGDEHVLPQTSLLHISTDASSHVTTTNTATSSKRHKKRKKRITSKAPINSSSLEDDVFSKRVRLSPVSPSPVALESSLPINLADNVPERMDNVPRTASSPVSVEAFKDEVLSRLARLPTERMKEIHKLVRQEIDAAYAQQIADEISSRFDETHRDTVMNRILNVLDQK